MSSEIKALKHIRRWTIPALVSFSLVAALVQWQKATDTSDENAQLKRVLQHHLATISKQNKQITELKTDKGTTLRVLANAKQENAQLRDQNDRLNAHVKLLQDENKVNQRVAAETVAQLAEENKDRANSSLPAQIVEEFVVAKLAVAWLRAQQKAAATQILAEVALNKCARNQAGMQPADLQIIRAHMRLARDGKPQSGKTSAGNQPVTLEDAAAKAYDMLARDLRKRAFDAAQRHCRL